MSNALPSRSAHPISYLFVPGNRPERFDKARAAGAGAVVVDLEDAVPAQSKDPARDTVIAALDSSRPVWVRVNAADTPWFERDVQALAGRPAVAGIMLPKAELPAQIESVMARAHAGLRVIPIIETARGFAGRDALCAASGVLRLAFGTLDFQVDTGIDGEAEELDFFRSALVLSSRLANLAAPLDGVSTVIDDPERIEAHARRGRRFGFGGKLCIHPRQLEAVHRAYAWTQAEQDWARRVLDAVAASAGAAVAVDGKMVDLPVILKARRILGIEAA
jgi:citrate lyase subunit beta/citryl-CoA lyase